MGRLRAEILAALRCRNESMGNLRSKNAISEEYIRRNLWYRFFV